VCSTVCILAWLGFLFSTWDVLTLLDAYFVPYLIFAAWLSLVTYLQHTDPLGVYYRDGEWTYLKVSCVILISPPQC
jgi:omega-3 fatty acid desaturase (delta-15 desaturase)